MDAQHGGFTNSREPLPPGACREQEEEVIARMGKGRCIERVL
jgi:hypothetical protein